MRIAISGAGIAGPTAAYWLARIGHEVTIVESAPVLRSGGYVIDFWGRGYEVAARMGLEHEIVRAGYAVRRVSIVGKAGAERASLSFDAFRRATHGRFTTIPRGKLAELLFKACAAQVEPIFGDTIVALEEHSRGVRTQFQSGASRDFDLVLGADGLHSAVRHLTFGPEERFAFPLGYGVAAFDIAGYRPRDELVSVMYNVPGRLAGRFSLRGDRTLFIFVFRARHDVLASCSNRVRREALIHQCFGGAGWECPRILEAMGRARHLYFDEMTQIRVPAWSQGRVALIGDAASCPSLLAGEGSGLAMIQAYVLAAELGAAGDDYRAAFERYEKRLRGFIEAKQRSAVSFAAMFAPRSILGVAIRNLFMRALNVPWIARPLLTRSLGDELILPPISASAGAAAVPVPSHPHVGSNSERVMPAGVPGDQRD